MGFKVFIAAIALMFCTTCIGKIKLYTMYTPTHERMYKNYFLPSVPLDCELITTFFPQDECPTGEFYSNGWHKMMQHKSEIILRGIQENWGDIFVYADVDIQFFRPIETYLRTVSHDYDLIGQQEWPYKHICGGFLVVRGNGVTKNFFECVAANCIKFGGDQRAINILLTQQKFAQLRHKTLDCELFPNGALSMGRSSDPSTKVKIDSNGFPYGAKFKINLNAFIHHANFTMGLITKEKFMEIIKLLMQKLHDESAGIVQYNKTS